MKRLIDAINEGPCDARDAPGGKIDLRSLDVSAVVYADQAATLAFPEPAFGVQRPPFDYMWLEWVMPLHNRPTLMGAFIKPADDIWPDPTDDGDSAYGFRFAHLAPRGRPELLPVGVGCYITAEGKVSGYWLADREQVYDESFIARTRRPTEEELRQDPLLVDCYLAGLGFQVARVALSLMNARNVTTVDHHLPPKVVKARTRRHGHPGVVTWKTIQLPAAYKPPTSGQALEPGKVPLHLVRGHFKTYTPDKPLFGSRTGTWWWPSMVRGNPENGVSGHDYEVKPRA